MRFLFALLPFALLTPQAEARDSIWLLCNNSGFALNALEHRSGAAERATELTLIYGGHVYLGSLAGSDEGAVKLVGHSSRNSVFNGRVAIDYSKNLANVRGELVINGEKFSISEHMTCNRLEGKL